MLDTALKEYFENACAFSTDTAELYYRVIREDKGVFKPTRELNALLVMKSSEINFRQVADELLKELSSVVSGKKAKVACRWIVCSERGGIYLYEAIATKENAAYKNLKSSFIVLNSLDGTVSFGPGHILNAQYSNRLRELIECSRSLSRGKWMTDFQALIDKAYQE